TMKHKTVFRYGAHCHGDRMSNRPDRIRARSALTRPVTERYLTSGPPAARAPTDTAPGMGDTPGVVWPAWWQAGQRWRSWRLAARRESVICLAVTGKLTIDTGWGRRIRPLGPFSIEIAAPAARVFDVIAAPYLGRTPRALAGKLRVIQQGKGMVLVE